MRRITCADDSTKTSLNSAIIREENNMRAFSSLKNYPNSTVDGSFSLALSVSCFKSFSVWQAMLLRLQMLTEHSGAHERLKSNQMVVEEFFFLKKDFFYFKHGKQERSCEKRVYRCWLAVGSWYSRRRDIELSLHIQLVEKDTIRYIRSQWPIH